MRTSMMAFPRTATTFCLLLISIAGHARSLPAHSAVHGGGAHVPLPTEADEISAWYDGDRVMVLGDERSLALVGIPLSAEAGSHTLAFETRGGERRQITFEVEPKQHLTIENERQVNLDNVRVDPALFIE